MDYALEYDCIARQQERLELLEQQLADKEVEIKRLGKVVMQTVENGNKQRHDAVSQLEAQNLVLMAAIEVKDEFIEFVTRNTTLLLQNAAFEALAVRPSSSLLEARDRKRDAKLLRIIVGIVPSVAKQLVEDWAVVRESGKWVPELGEEL